MMNDELYVVHLPPSGLDAHKGHITATVRLAAPPAAEPGFETRMFNDPAEPAKRAGVPPIAASGAPSTTARPRRRARVVRRNNIGELMQQPVSSRRAWSSRRLIGARRSVRNRRCATLASAAPGGA